MNNEQPIQSVYFDGDELRLAKNLLGLCGSPEASPIESLIARLEEPGASAWALGVLNNAPSDQGHTGYDTVVNGAGGVEAATILKDHAKRMLGRSEDRETKTEAVLLYTLAVAAALKHAGVMISSRSPVTVQEHLLTVSAFLPPALSAVVTNASRALEPFVSDTGPDQ
jgi:hypothetical protein